jgi:dipeptide/tripeptide permease
MSEQRLGESQKLLVAGPISGTENLSIQWFGFYQELVFHTYVFGGLFADFRLNTAVKHRRER